MGQVYLTQTLTKANNVAILVQKRFPTDIQVNGHLLILCDKTTVIMVNVNGPSF